MSTTSRGAPNRWSIQVRPRENAHDGHGREVLADVRRLGFAHVEGVRSSRFIFLQGNLTQEDITLLAEQLFTDPVIETCETISGFSARDMKSPSVEVHPLPGVMDPVAISAHQAAQRLLDATGRTHAKVTGVSTARRYEFVGARSSGELQLIADKVLANDCIETWYIQGFDRSDAIPDAFPVPPQRAFELKHIAIRELDDDGLRKLSREGHLFLSLEEMRTIRDYYKKLDREPTDLELETLAQTWSEHCVHKTLKSAVAYEGDDFGRAGKVSMRFENLLKETIAAATEELNRNWCLSVFVDNAGVIAFDEEFGVAFKAETHNHPSAIEPYGGAATGIGGCIRDVMGCGLGAKPIASTDVFCLAPPDFEADRVPIGVLHPRRVLKGVVGGVRDYGNRMGIPTVNGALYFDERYLANPLVFCGCVGLIPRDRIHKQPNPDDYIVVAGGRTGRDGIHGATFSSAELTETHADEFSHAVQIGNAIQEKTLLDAQLIARDHADGCLYSAVTDCGAGGLSSAVGEMGETLGVVVDLEEVPLKYSGLRYDEIWISEAQERMVFAVPPEKLEAFLAVFNAEEVEATVIGRFTSDKILRVRYGGVTVGELDMAFLHDGLPKATRTARWTKRETRSKNADAQKDAGNDKLLAALSVYNTASKEWVIRQYDHEVQGRSVVKPWIGERAGPTDAAVLRPRHDKPRGIALGCGLCPERSDDDPYTMAIVAIDEALRNVICVGADPERTAILDNFCWPGVATEESMGALVRTCRGAYDAAIAYGLPFISGKDSLNNEFTMSAAEAQRVGLPQRLAIPPTLLISALGIVEDVNGCVTMDLKRAGNVLVVASAPVDEVGLEAAYALHTRVAGLIAEQKVRAAHDVSDGGLAVALAEMVIASGLGVEVELTDKTWSRSVYAEVPTTYVLEMSESDAKASDLPIIGRVTESPRLEISRDDNGSKIAMIDAGIDELADAWRTPLVEGGGR